MNGGKQPRPLIDRAEGEIDDPEVNEPEEKASLDGDEALQREILSKIKTFNEKGKSNRMADVQNARDQRLYFKGIQQFYWSEDRQDVIFDSADDSPYDRTFNVTQGYGKIYIATFMGAKPKVRAVADDPFNPQCIRDTSKAKTYERIYRKNNDISDQQLQIARLMWTDGRIVTQTSTIGDKQITKHYGVLESRLSVNAKCLDECTLLQLEDEYPIAQKKRQYPDARKKLSSGAGDSYERNARIAVKRQAGTDSSIDVQTGEDNYGLVTITTSMMRPDFYEEFQDSTRAQLEEMFPDGLCVIHSGDTYLESFEHVMDDHMDVLHAMPGDGMSRPSIGASMMPLQDSINTSMNLIEEMFDHGIPTTYYDESTNIDGLNKQREMPGASRKMTKRAGEPASNFFFETTAVNPPVQLLQYAENLRGPISQFASGQQPASFGADMPDQKTAHGYEQAKQMALGLMAIVWKPFTSWYSRETTRAVRLASKQPNEITANLSPEQPGAKPEAVRISPGELTGASFTNESDENFPESFSEKGNKFMGVMQAAGPLGDELLQEPDNLYFAKQVWGLDDLVIPGEDIRNNVLEDIAQMKNEQPIPDPSQMPQQAFPQMGQPPAPPPLISSIKIDMDYLDQKDLSTGYAAVKRWINSVEGREAKIAYPLWFQNVSLYGLQYKNGIQSPTPATKPPSISFVGNNLPPEAQAQALAADGIHVDPQSIVQQQQIQQQNAIQQKTAVAPGAMNA